MLAAASNGMHLDGIHLVKTVLRLVRGMRWMSNPYAFFRRSMQQHGLTFTVDLPVLGKSFVTGQPELLRQLASHPKLQAGMAVPALRALLGEESLITLDGARHTARRRLVAPVFRDRLPEFDRLAVEATLQTTQQFCGARPLSIYEPLRRISLLVILRAMFGSDAAVLEEGYRLVDTFIHSFSNPLILFARPLRTDLGPLSPWGRAMLNRRALCEFIAARIRCQQNAGSGNSGSMLAHILCNPEAASVAEKPLVQEILALLLFGHDTGAAALSWAVVHLLQHPATVKKICAETAHGNADDWPFLQACLNESLRLCPVVPHLSRVASEDVELGEHKIVAGQTVVPCTYMAHHNPLIFPQPEEFRPQRFAGGQSYSSSYFPFGIGDRTCVGRPFIMRQMTVILATLFQNANLTLAPGYTPQAVRKLLLITPSRGGRVIVQHRTPQPEFCREYSHRGAD